MVAEPLRAGEVLVAMRTKMFAIVVGWLLALFLGFIGVADGERFEGGLETLHLPIVCHWKEGPALQRDVHNFRPDREAANDDSRSRRPVTPIDVRNGLISNSGSRARLVDASGTPITETSHAVPSGNGAEIRSRRTLTEASDTALRAVPALNAHRRNPEVTLTSELGRDATLESRDDDETARETLAVRLELVPDRDALCVGDKCREVGDSSVMLRE